jgi:hypothetical protein
MRLQVDDEKVPARPFTLRCPKCQNIVQAQPPPVRSEQESAFTVGNSPASGHPRIDTPSTSQHFKLDSSVDRGAAQPDSISNTQSTENKDLLRMLATLLQRGSQSADKSGSGSRFDWESRHVLVCVGDGERESVARVLAECEYQLYVAENKNHALERMRDERIDVMILAPDFDLANQGAAFMTREVNSMRLSERRRLFLVHLSDMGRTQDAHAAFISNVSLIVNPSDIEKMPRAIERTMRDYNELYRGFNDALGARAI